MGSPLGGLNAGEGNVSRAARLPVVALQACHQSCAPERRCHSGERFDRLPRNLQVTQRAYERESKLNASVAELRGKLRRAGLLDNQPRMQRRTLVRASRRQGSDSSGSDLGSGDEEAARPSTVEEEEEGATDEGLAESGGGAPEHGSSDGDSDEHGDPVLVAAAGASPQEVDSGAAVGAVQSQRGGGAGGSISEVAGAHREGSVSPGAGRASAGGSDVPVRSSLE